MRKSRAGAHSPVRAGTNSSGRAGAHCPARAGGPAAVSAVRRGRAVHASVPARHSRYFSMTWPSVAESTSSSYPFAASSTELSPVVTDSIASWIAVETFGYSGYAGR